MTRFWMCNQRLRRRGVTTARPKHTCTLGRHIQMSFNPKCTILRVSCSKSLVEYHQFTTHGEPLEAFDHHKFLGVELSGDLNWSVHTAGIIGKANRSLDFIRRNLKKFPGNVKEQSYLAIDRPQPEYGCCAWIPHIKLRIKVRASTLAPTSVRVC